MREPSEADSSYTTRWDSTAVRGDAFLRETLLLLAVAVDLGRVDVERGALRP